MPVTKKQIIDSLRKAYNIEVETVINYLANSLHLEGVRAEFIKQALATDIHHELSLVIPSFVRRALDDRYGRPTADRMARIRRIARSRSRERDEDGAR